MRRIRIVGLCLAAIFALTAIMATSASALNPEVGRCIKLAGGKYKAGTCKTLAKTAEEKKWEWYPAFVGGVVNETPSKPKLKYSSKSKEGALIKLETLSGETVLATGQTSLGEVTGEQTNVATKIIFTGVNAFESLCTSTKPKGTNPGEVLVNDLSGKIGIEKNGLEGNHEKDKAANLFVPKIGTIFTEFECAGIPIVVRHEVMNPVTSNAMKLTATVKFAATKGKQKPEKFVTDVAGTKRVLESNKLGGAFEQAGQTLTTIQTNEEKLEVSTVH